MPEQSIPLYSFIWPEHRIIKRIKLDGLEVEMLVPIDVPAGSQIIVSMAPIADCVSIRASYVEYSDEAIDE